MKRFIAIAATIGTIAVGMVALTAGTAPAVEFTGHVDAAGKSWSPHTFPVSVGDTIDATMTWTPTASDLNLFLRDETGTAVKNSSSKLPSEHITWVAQSSGSYLLGAKAKTGAGDYTITLEITPAVTTTDSTTTTTTTNPPVGTPIGTDWSKFHFDTANHGASPDTDLSTDNVAQLGVDWQANTGAKAYTSPAVVYRPNLGKTLVIVGRQSGEIIAFDAETGARVWNFVLTSHVQSSPAVVDGVVYIGTSDRKLFALDADTGAVRCQFDAPGVFSASPVVADVDGTGLTVFLGENGITGGDDGGHFWAIHAVDPDDGAADCSLRWSYDAFGQPEGSMQGSSGSWSPPALATDATGRPLVVFGGSSPDNAIYALDARDGTRVWRYGTQVFSQDNDVGAGPTISAPGVNGFADGVVYVEGKNRIVYALNLRTGALIWQFSIRTDSPTATTATVSSPALVGNSLLVGYGLGLYRLNATTGARIWRSGDVGPTQMVYASPAVSGPAGKEVVFSADAAGKVLAHSLATGQILWSFQTGDFIYGSPAVVGSRVFIASTDGFVYAFRTGAATGGRPDTTVTAPTADAVLDNTGAPVLIQGDATDDVGVAGVRVAIKNRNTNKWWSGTAWVKGYTELAATVQSPGSPTTTWSYPFAVPAEGGPFYAQAAAVDGGGQQDSVVASVKFSLGTRGAPPETTITAPVFKQIFRLGDPWATFPITVYGTASDTGGANPGVKKVRVVIKNREHEEYFCGPPGCSPGGHGGAQWTPTYKVIDATLSNPGATSTGWTVTIPAYDHPHSYSVTAWAMDNDNEADQTRASVWRFCVRVPGDNFCA